MSDGVFVSCLQVSIAGQPCGVEQARANIRVSRPYCSVKVNRVHQTGPYMKNVVAKSFQSLKTYSFNSDKPS